MGEVVPPIPEVLSRETFWNTLAAIELAQAGDPTTDNMNALGLHDAALRDALSADRIEGVLTLHRLDDEARTCTCGEWKWEPGPARPSELHRMHVAHMIAEVRPWVR